MGWGQPETAADRERKALRKVLEAARAYLAHGTTGNIEKLSQAVEDFDKGDFRNDQIAKALGP